MKKTILLSFYLILSGVLLAQPNFDLGIKGGINNSKVSLSIDDYNSESILKAHIGAFARLGWGRIYVQPEAYFSTKGGDLSSNVVETATSFDYSTVDVPLLLGIKILKGGVVDLHFNAGPVFSFVTSDNIDGDLSSDYIGDNYVGVQYGLGVDMWFLTLDARMEHGSEDLYSHPEFSAKTNMFVLSLGIRFL